MSDEYPPIIPDLTDDEVDGFLAAVNPEDGPVHASIRSNMSDLEIVNEIIRVVGYERLDIIIDMLEDRLRQVSGIDITFGERNEVGVVKFQWPPEDLHDRVISGETTPTEAQAEILRRFAPPKPWSPDGSAG